MGPPSYMRSVVDPNDVMPRKPVVIWGEKKKRAITLKKLFSKGGWK